MVLRFLQKFDFYILLDFPYILLFVIGASHAQLRHKELTNIF